MPCFDCFCGIFGGGASAKKADLVKAKAQIKEMIAQKSNGPILLRTAWHDAGTWDKNNRAKPWPNAGGAVGSIRTDHEISAPPNAGLQKAVQSYLKPIKTNFPGISWADLIQLAGATAVEEMGGPAIAMKYGRVDGEPTEKAPVPFGLPAAKGPFGQPGVRDSGDAAEHLRFVFYKYEMDDKDIVALSGSHTVGRAFADRSGAVSEPSGSAGTKYTARGMPEGKNSMTGGGRSWVRDWLVFNNSYFTDMGNNDPETVTFPTDAVLMQDPGFKPHFDRFAKDQPAFFAAYADAHKRLSELGSKFEPPAGITGV